MKDGTNNFAGKEGLEKGKIEIDVLPKGLNARYVAICAGMDTLCRDG